MGVLWRAVRGWGIRLSSDRGRLGVALLTLALGLGVNADLLHFERKDRSDRKMAGAGHYAAVSQKLSAVASTPLSDGEISMFVRGMMEQRKRAISSCTRSHRAPRTRRALIQERCLRALRALRAGRAAPAALPETSWAPDDIIAPVASPSAVPTALAPLPAPGLGSSGCPSPSRRGSR